MSESEPPGGTVRLPKVVFAAILNALGGSIALSATDYMNFSSDIDVVMTEYRDPYRVVFKVVISDAK